MNTPLGPKHIRFLVRSLIHGFAEAEQEPTFSKLGSWYEWPDRTPLHRVSAQEEPAFSSLLHRIADFFGLPAYALGGLTPDSTLDEAASLLAAAMEPLPETIYFHTSGSTGEPVVIPQSLSHLLQEAEDWAGYYHDRRRIVGLVPCRHIYGFLFTMLLPPLLQTETVFKPFFPSGDFCSALLEGDLVIGFPLFWTRLVELNPVFPAGVICMNSTGPCPENVVRGLLAAGSERVVEAYGSSETGGIGRRDTPGGAYTLLSIWQDFSQPDAGEEPCLERILPDGTQKTYPLPDTVEILGDREFRPAGRKDKSVQVAGVNVYPLRVAEILKAHPEVRECRVRLMRADEGDRLKAFIVPVRDDAETKALLPALREWCRDKLTPPERPGKWTFGKALPVSDMGKAADW